MIIDLRQQQSGRRQQADLCIVGAGAAGITIAQYFVESGVEVCIVESGGLEFEDDTQQLYSGASIGQHVGLDTGRLRFLGGTTNHWGGRCAELSAAEIAKRDWVPFSGWPLGRDDLRPYYDRARAVCGFSGEWIADAKVPSWVGVSSLDASSTEVDTQIWRYVPHEGEVFWNFGHAYRDKLKNAKNVNLLLHANLTRIATSADAKHVTGLTVQSLTGVTCDIAASQFILCCGGVENARLLLLGSEHAPNGLGNANDLVGRFFMQHIRADAATLFTSERLSPVQDMYNDFTGADGIQYEIGLALSEAAQHSQKLLNCSAIVPYEGDPEAGTTAAQDIWRRLREGRWTDELGTKVWRVMNDLPAFWSNAERRFLHNRHPLLPLRSAKLIVDIEQVPNPDSRVMLGPDPDRLGMRKTVVDWRLSPMEQRTARYFMMAVGADFARRGIGRLKMEPWLEATDQSWTDAVSETCHHTGTTRMADDPSQGVVDRNCMVHGMDNLFVAGSSVFPTNGHVNPTFTITALALRLADHLKEILGRRS